MPQLEIVATGCRIIAVSKPAGKVSAKSFILRSGGFGCGTSKFEPVLYVPYPQLLSHTLSELSTLSVLSAGIQTEVLVDDLSRVLGRPLSMVSRLDLPTSGVLPIVLGSGDSYAAAWYRSCFAGRLVSKEYVCLCEGMPLGALGAKGTITKHLSTRQLPDGGKVAEVSEEGKEARTEYEIIRRYLPPCAAGGAGRELILLRVQPRTGRTHQIRVHLACLGRPLVGDLTYGHEKTMLECPRLFLHCCKASLVDAAKQNFTAVASLPAELQEVLSALQSVDACTRFVTKNVAHPAMRSVPQCGVVKQSNMLQLMLEVLMFNLSTLIKAQVLSSLAADEFCYHLRLSIALGTSWL